MNKFIKKSCTCALGIISIAFSFIPESTFEKYKFSLNNCDEVNIFFTRFMFFVLILFVTMIINALFLRFRRHVRISGYNYIIQVEYGNLFEMRDCKKVINFDECFTTIVGDAPSEIKPTSICGQYLEKNEIQDMQSLIDKANLKPSKSKSKYQNKVRYDSGKLVPNGDYLLMAFAKLDENGAGRFYSRDEFLDCLSILWKEINLYYGQQDVCIPILGSGVTRMDSESNALLTQQELLDIIICSYKLSQYKIKPPHQLRIVCKEETDFSLNKIGENF